MHQLLVSLYPRHFGSYECANRCMTGHNCNTYINCSVYHQTGIDWFTYYNSKLMQQAMGWISLAMNLKKYIQYVIILEINIISALVVMRPRELVQYNDSWCLVSSRHQATHPPPPPHPPTHPTHPHPQHRRSLLEDVFQLLSLPHYYRAIVEML